MVPVVKISLGHPKEINTIKYMIRKFGKRGWD